MIRLLLALSLAVPNPVHTPGVVRPMTSAEVCAVRWGTDSRKVTAAMRRQVFAWYGIPQHERRNYEVDHLIPRSAGGADDVRNLWPQAWVPWARLKDRLETRLHKLVCVTGSVSLADAQAVFRGDWRHGYERYVGPLPEAVRIGPVP